MAGPPSPELEERVDRIERVLHRLRLEGLSDAFLNGCATAGVQTFAGALLWFA